MGNRVVFQFEELAYQEKAINSVVELFRGLPKEGSEIYSGIIRKTRIDEKDPVRNKSIITGSKLLENLKKVQLANELFSDDKIENNNFTIEMETGTGKTYVYLRTAIRLFKEYGFKKFMIIVPTVAIRKGVEKSIEQLREHFKRLEGIDIGKHSFIYDSDNLGKVSTNFVENNDLSICVMNIQAFNSDKNKIRKDDEYGKILWNDIKFLRPIIIIDEPQKIEGQKGKKSKSLQALDELEPLFTLRYSATHKNLYNQIYKLDSFQAYKQNLVKKIKVKTINSIVPKDYPYIRYIKFTSDLKARIEIFYQEQGGIIKFKSFDVLGNISLEELSGGLNQYSGMYVAENPHKEKPLKIITSTGEIYLKLGESNNKVDNKEAIRIQIRLAIQSHFEKQLSILKKNKLIKILTLFFIDEVNKVRDEKSEDGRGEYLKIFDEEYTKILWKYEKDIEKYKEFFPNYKNVLQVREGYFARDKKNNIVEIEDWDSSRDEVEVKAKSQEDIDRGISLILEKKDELISFREPLSFIFSHSALREGWDNPNVFILCTLKQGSSDIAKKQEIGRGLRLPVDTNGNRCLDAEVNELIVIANDSYENFSTALQKDFNKDRNLNEVTADILIKTLKKAGISKSKVTSELVDKLKNELILNKIIDSNNILNKNIDEMKKALENIEFINEIFQEYIEEIKDEFIKIMSDRCTSHIEIKNGDNPEYENGYTSLIDQESFSKIFEGLSSKLTKKTFYKCKIDNEKYIEESILLINEELKNYVKATSVRITEASGEYGDAEEFTLKKEIDFDKDIEITEKVVVEKSDFEIVQYIMYHTMLPRLAIFRIIAGIEKRFALNSQDILENISQLLLNKLNEMKAKNIISYEVVDNYEIDVERIFAMDNISEEDFEKEWRVFKAKKEKTNSMNLYYKLDSAGEKEFAQQLEHNENILLFTKLKKGGFIIDTPYGNYSPDWAIIYKNPDKDSDKKIGVYFIIESKIDKEWNDLTGEEQDKINCGKLHFKAISELVKFDWIKNYQDFKKKFQIKDTI